MDRKKYGRKEFIAFLGKASLGAAVAPPFLVRCGMNSAPLPSQALSAEHVQRLKDLVLESLEPSDADDLLLTSGLDHHVVVKWLDRINDDDTFGFNCDFNCFLPFDEEDPNDGLLWVNHEYPDPLFVSGYNFTDPQRVRTKEQVDKEMYSVGGSIVRVRKENGKWQVVPNDPHNRRITAHTPIRLNWDAPIKGKNTVIGTHSNCAGGITPWKTFLTCEENYYECYGETQHHSDGSTTLIPSDYGWEQYYDHPPEHYGWVVEIDP
ncbi:MAG: DUF839 domain-containing protein, partial [Flavobacteriales bacterium]|nr:DUF839 domain-containing protein [Flavobacteriales bacterium]